LSKDKDKGRKFGSVSLPMGVLEVIDALINELRYRPSRSSFAREACLEKIRRERNRLKELKDPDNPLKPS